MDNAIATQLDAWKEYIYLVPSQGRRQIVFKFQNGYGASIIPDTWEPTLVELAVVRFRTEGGFENFYLVYDTPVTSDVLKLDETEIFPTLQAIKELPCQDMEIVPPNKISGSI